MNILRNFLKINYTLCFKRGEQNNAHRYTLSLKYNDKK
jgi:hypothetical protein